jgi:hypothetical protein
MIGPMLVLITGCFSIGLAPLTVAPVLECAMEPFTSGTVAARVRLVDLAPLVPLSAMGVALIGVSSLGGLIIARKRPVGDRSAGTWDCGYAAPSPSMQYTSSSFAQMLVSLFGWLLRPKLQVHHPAGLFARTGAFHSQVDDTALERAILPAFRGVATLFGWLRVLQPGSIQLYLLYVFATLVALLLWW